MVNGFLLLLGEQRPRQGALRPHNRGLGFKRRYKRLVWFWSSLCSAKHRRCRKMLSFCCLPFRVKVDGTIPFLPGMMKPTLGIVPTFTSIQRERAWVLLRNMQSLTVFFGNDIGSTQIVFFFFRLPFQTTKQQGQQVLSKKDRPI